METCYSLQCHSDCYNPSNSLKCFPIPEPY